ncbi:MAG: cell division protein SepF [Armatimonadota bacterium]
MASASPLKKFLTWWNAEDEEEEFETVETTAETPVPAPNAKRQRGPLVLHSGGEGGVVIRHPRTLDDRMAIGMDLKQRRLVTLDLTKLPDADARYFLEFIYGVVFALDATAEKVTEGIYSLAPRGVAVENDLVSEATTSSTRSSSRAGTSRDEQEELFWQGR